MEIWAGNPAHAFSVHICEEGMGSRGHGPSRMHYRVRAFFNASDNQSHYMICSIFLNIRSVLVETGAENPAHAISGHICEEVIGYFRSHGPELWHPTAWPILACT